LPDEATTRKGHKALGEAGVDGCFYWYDNNWHYIKKWEHLKQLKSLGKMPQEIVDGMRDYDKSDFPASDAIIRRTVSVLVKLSWSEEQLRERAEKMVKAIRGAIG